MSLFIKFIMLFVVTLVPLEAFSDEINIPPVKTGVTNRIVAVAKWDTEDANLICVVIEEPKIVLSESEGTPTKYILQVFKINNENSYEVYKEKFTGDILFNVFQYGFTENKLYINWSGRRYISTDIYAFKNGTVTKVLSTSSDGLPEIKLGPSNSELLVVRNDEYLGKKHIVKKYIYKWNKLKYKFDLLKAPK